MRGAAGCLEVMLAQGADVMSTDGAGTSGRAPGGWQGCISRPEQRPQVQLWDLTAHTGAVAQ